MRNSIEKYSVMTPHHNDPQCFENIIIKIVILGETAFRSDPIEAKDKKITHFQLAKALAVLSVDASTFHSLHMQGEYDKVRTDAQGSFNTLLVK